MYRETIQERPDWQRKVLDQGLLYYLTNGERYWGEGACYRFTSAQVDEIEAATQELHGMCLNAVNYVIANNLFDKFKIPAPYVPLIRQSWENNDPYIFGRFDLSYDGSRPPKMLEYNADTPTSLPEAAVIQWYWLQDHIKAGVLPAKADQFNSIHESLVAAWKQVANEVVRPLYLACEYGLEGQDITNLEDYQNVQYMRDTCEQAGIETEIINLQDIGWNGQSFTDLDENRMNSLFKLYPWEQAIQDEFGPHLTKDAVRVFEPAWKMILSNKAILPVLWTMYPGHPNLLPAFFEPGKIKGDYVVKPIFGREGANVRIVENGKTTTVTEGVYGAEGYVYQAYQSLPEFDGYYPVIGSWVTSERPAPETELKPFPRGGRACGMGIREDTSPVTRNVSRFVPHYFL